MPSQFFSCVKKQKSIKKYGAERYKNEEYQNERIKRKIQKRMGFFHQPQNPKNSIQQKV